MSNQASKAALSIPGPRKIWVIHNVEQTIEQVPFDVDKLIHTRLSNTSWSLLSVPAEQIEPTHSDWYQISSAPGMHIAGKSYGKYRVAVDRSYLPWLLSSSFNFKMDLEPMKPVDVEVRLQGKWVATKNADARFVQDAFSAISSGRNPGLDICYRTPHWRDNNYRLNGQSCCMTCLLDDYCTGPAPTLLGANEDELFKGLRNLCTERSTYRSRNSIADFEAEFGSKTAQDTAQLHMISLFRCLLELADGKKDLRQHKFNPEHTANYNTNTYCSVVGTTSSKAFGTSDLQKLLDALSKSPLFPSETICTLNVVDLSTQMMAYLPIGLSDGVWDIPIDVASKIGRGQVDMICVQMAHFFHEHPSLEKPENTVPVFLACSSTRSIAGQVLADWVDSTNGWRVYKRIVKDIHDSQTAEQLTLALAALLCYQRFLPLTSDDTKQSIKGSYQVDFNAILNGECLGNDRTVFECMAFSILRVFSAVKYDEKIRRFLVAVLDIDPLVLDLCHEILDQYWIYRMKERLTHKDAFKMTELKYLTKTVGLTIGSEKEIVIKQEQEQELDRKNDEEDDQMEILDDEEEQEEEQEEKEEKEDVIALVKGGPIDRTLH